MCIERISQDFNFKSGAGGKILLWLCGIAPILLSVGVLFLILSPPRLTGEYLLSAVLFELILWVLGFAILSSACEIEILDRRLRFRRLVTWRSVPLKSVTRVRILQAPGIYVRVDYRGKHYRLLFYPGQYEESHAPHVIEFLEEVCDMNTRGAES
jgi:hypothetical protein